MDQSINNENDNLDGNDINPNGSMLFIGIGIDSDWLGYDMIIWYDVYTWYEIDLDLFSFSKVVPFKQACLLRQFYKCKFLDPFYTGSLTLALYESNIWTSYVVHFAHAITPLAGSSFLQKYYNLQCRFINVHFELI